MPLPPERYVKDAAEMLQIPLDPAWVPLIAEHLGRLLDAWQVIEEAGLCKPEP